MPKELQRSILGGFWGPFGSPLGSFFEHVGGSVALLGHPLGPKWSQKRQDEGLLGSGRGARGAQRLSGFDFETIFIICCLLFGIFVCLFGEKGFGMFCESKVLFIMVAALHWSYFS